MGAAHVCGASALSDGLGGFFFVRTQESIDSRLVAWPLGLEPIEDIRVDTQGNDSLRGNRLEAPSHDSANNMLSRGLGVLNGQSDVPIRGGSDARPISFGFA